MSAPLPGLDQVGLLLLDLGARVLEELQHAAPERLDGVVRRLLRHQLHLLLTRCAKRSHVGNRELASSLEAAFALPE